MNIKQSFGEKTSEIAPPTDLSPLELERVQRRRKIILIATAVTALLIVGILLYRAFDREPITTEAAPRVTVVVPRPQLVARNIDVTGTLAARREMPVGVAGEGGMIARVLVDAGDWVRAGQVLAVIDSAVEAQQANQLRAQIAAARADAALAEAELKRAESLVGRGFVSKADVDRKTATRDAARARVAVAQAQLGEIQARIGRLVINAPAGGLILTRAVEPGQVVSPGSGALFRIAKDGEMELRARLAEADLSLLSVGAQAVVTPVGSTRGFTGRIWQLSPIIDPQSRQGEARIALAFDRALRPGGFASVEIRGGQTNAPVLPESAVLNDETGSFVYIVGPDNKVARRDVKIGPVGKNGLPIVAGLLGSEKVVVSAGAFLSPGDTILPAIERKP